MAQLKVLSPVEVSQKYLTSEELMKRVDENFNILKIEELIDHISFPNAPFKNTSHGFILLIEGEIKMMLNQEEFKFNEKSFVITPAGQMNNFVQINSKSIGYIGTFNDSILSNHSETNSIEIFQDILSPDKFPHFVLDVRTFEVLNQVLNRIWELHNNNRSTGKSKIIQSYFISVLLEIQHLSFKKEGTKKSKSDKLVSNFKKILAKEIKETFQPKDFAAKLNVSTNHLNKVLKNRTKKTTSEWINEQRLLEAKYHLKYSSKSISEISYLLGFTEPSHFAKFFKKLTQLKPTDYKMIE
ncbi:MAG: helix-turn-helix domain-containing protein [Bacteroidota bacterium]